MKTKALKWTLAAALTSALMACGGGGDSTGSSVSAEGIWSDDTTALFVLEDGETWGIYGNTSGINAAAGILQGQLTTTGNTVSGNLRDVSLIDPDLSNTVAVSGTTVPGQSLILQPQDGTPLSMTYDASYDTPANLTTMAGTYGGSAISSNGLDDNAIVVIHGGAIDAYSGTALDCEGHGSVALRNSSKAIVNFSITFGGTGCLFTPGTVIQGVAQVINGTLVMIGLDGGRTQGLLVLGNKTAS